MNIIIHIGGWKTGTTTIQHFCSKNRDKLLKNGICYPGIEINHLAHLRIHLSGSLEESQKNINNFINESIKKKSSIMLLSAEGLHSEIPFFDFHGYPVYIIQYIRQFPSYNESGLSQIIKSPFLDSWRGLNNRRIMFFQGIPSAPDILTRLRIFRCKIWHENGADGELAWTKKISKLHRIDTFSYEDACKEGLLQHFCSQIGISDLTSFTKPPQNANVTPCTAALFFMAHCNCLPLSFSLREELLTYLEQNQVTEDSNKYLLVEPDIYRQWMCDEHEVMQEMADLIGDPSWIDKCYAWLEGKKAVPYDNLPPHLQHEIFANLPKHFQEAIKEAWLIARIARPDEALLPPLPSSIELQECIQSWYDSYLEQWFQKQAQEQNMAILRNEVENLRHLVSMQEQELQQTRTTIEALRRSLSWRVTAPLRALAAPIARILKK